jgi:hypothetical protein
MTRVVGIDPGKLGAIATLFGSATPIVLPTPVYRSAKGRPEYALVEIRDLLRSWAAEGPMFAVVEKQQPMPRAMGGAAANFARGVAAGWAWMLVALEIPHLLVAPQTWQRAMHAGTPDGDTKQRSLIAAQRLFPGVSLRPTSRCRKDSDGMAEALLLAAYGQRVIAGQGVGDAVA